METDDATQVQRTDPGLDPLDVLEFGAKTGKRATHEAFAFAPGDGTVEVTNESHGDAADEHTYVVSIQSGIPFDCTCPAWQYHDGACKHMVAVALSEPVIEAAAPDRELVADGGEVVEEDGGLEDFSSYRADEHDFIVECPNGDCDQEYVDTFMGDSCPTCGADVREGR